MTQGPMPAAPAAIMCCLQLYTLLADRVVGGCNLECLFGQLLGHVSRDVTDRTAVSAVLAQLLPPLVRCVPGLLQQQLHMQNARHITSS